MSSGWFLWQPHVVRSDGDPAATAGAAKTGSPSAAASTSKAASVPWSLRGFTGAGYDKGRPKIVQAMWFAVSNLVFMKWWLPARYRVSILRAFGATVGDGVLIRHGVRVHWPWKLTVGADCWIGERAWLLNLEPIRLGSDVCLSQESFLCTGSHDRFSPTFEFDNAPIEVGDGAWVGARSTVLRGVRVGAHSVIGAGAVVARDVIPGTLVPAATSGAGRSRT
jgi:putative colanic acid biosynthesis acetyltransferase WcaF